MRKDREFLDSHTHTHVCVPGVAGVEAAAQNLQATAEQGIAAAVMKMQVLTYNSHPQYA